MFYLKNHFVKRINDIQSELESVERFYHKSCSESYEAIEYNNNVNKKCFIKRIFMKKKDVSTYYVEFFKKRINQLTFQLERCEDKLVQLEVNNDANNNRTK